MNGVKTAALFGILGALLVLLGYWIGGTGGATLFLIIALGINAVSYFFSDRIALASMRARPVSEAQQPQMYAIVREPATSAHQPMPRLYVSPTRAPNAFATGRSPRHAAVCCTEGILQLLNARELRAVLGHELSHVYNRDILISSVAGAIATGITYIAQFALFFGGGYGSEEEERDVMIVVLVSVVVYAVSFLLLRALSRYREFAADRGSAVLTGRPSALASALLKISGTIERLPSEDLRRAEGMSAFFIVPARTKRSLMNLFADHPPLEQRLAALERLEAQLQGVA
jgi:heat shock protein HtpX